MEKTYFMDVILINNFIESKSFVLLLSGIAKADFYSKS